MVPSGKPQLKGSSMQKKWHIDSRITLTFFLPDNWVQSLPTRWCWIAHLCSEVILPSPLTTIISRVTWATPFYPDLVEEMFIPIISCLLFCCWANAIICLWLGGICMVCQDSQIMKFPDVFSKVLTKRGPAPPQCSVPLWDFNVVGLTDRRLKGKSKVSRICLLSSLQVIRRFCSYYRINIGTANQAHSVAS
jgi:hypothetical protein